MAERQHVRDRDNNVKSRRMGPNPMDVHRTKISIIYLSAHNYLPLKLHIRNTSSRKSSKRKDLQISKEIEEIEPTAS